MTSSNVFGQFSGIHTPSEPSVKNNLGRNLNHLAANLRRILHEYDSELEHVRSSYLNASGSKKLSGGFLDGFEESLYQAMTQIDISFEVMPFLLRKAYTDQRLLDVFAEYQYREIFFSTVLSGYCSQRRSEGLETHLTFHGDPDIRYNNIFSFLRNVDSLHLINVNGGNIARFLGSYGGRVESFTFEGNSGMNSFENLGSNQGKIDEVLISGRNIGELGFCKLASQEGEIDRIRIRAETIAKEAGQNIASTGGKVRLLDVRARKITDNFGRSIASGGHIEEIEIHAQKIGENLFSYGARSKGRIDKTLIKANRIGRECLSQLGKDGGKLGEVKVDSTTISLGLARNLCSHKGQCERLDIRAKQTISQNCLINVASNRGHVGSIEITTENLHLGKFGDNLASANGNVDELRVSFRDRRTSNPTPRKKKTRSKKKNSRTYQTVHHKKTRTLRNYSGGDRNIGSLVINGVTIPDLERTNNKKGVLL